MFRANHQPINYNFSSTHNYKMTEIRQIKALFLEGFSPQEIGKKLRINAISIERMVGRLIDQNKLILEVDLTKITTNFLNDLLIQKLPQYHVTKVFGDGWCIFNRSNKLVKKLGNYKYSVYKKLQEFINENI